MQMARKQQKQIDECKKELARLDKDISKDGISLSAHLAKQGKPTATRD